jgi:hypothetical protein
MARTLHRLPANIVNKAIGAPGKTSCCRTAAGSICGSARSARREVMGAEIYARRQNARDALVPLAEAHTLAQKHKCSARL